MNKPMTAQEFVDKNNQCPKCGSENVSWGQLSVEGDSTFQDASCDDCDATFNTISRLVGYTLYEWGTAECETRTIDADRARRGKWRGRSRWTLDCLVRRIRQSSSQPGDQLGLEPEPGRPSGEWMEVFLGLLSIVEDEYESDPEPEDIPSWKDLIDRANRLLRSKQEQTEKGKDDGDTEQKRSGT